MALAGPPRSHENGLPPSLFSHQSKGNSANVAFTEFYEVQLRNAEHSSVRRVMSSSCSHPSPVKRSSSSNKVALRPFPPSKRSLRRLRRRGVPTISPWELCASISPSV